MSEMAVWEAPSNIPANEKLLAWLESNSQPSRPKGMEFYGHKLQAHPDLYELFEPGATMGDFPMKRIAAFGVPALAHRNGVIFLFAFGASFVYLRGVDVPSALTIDELGPEWQGLEPWFPPDWPDKTIEQRVKKDQEVWMDRVRDYASVAYSSAAQLG